MDKLIQLIRDLLLSVFAYKAGKLATNDKYIKARDAKLEKYKELDKEPIKKKDAYDVESWCRT